MTTTMLTELGIDRWTVAQRIALVQQILDSVAAEQPPPAISDELMATIMRRDAELEANPEIAMTWQEIRAAVEAGR